MTEEIVFCKGGGCTAKLGPDLFKSRAWQNPKRGKRSGSSDRI